MRTYHSNMENYVANIKYHYINKNEFNKHLRYVFKWLKVIFRSHDRLSDKNECNCFIAYLDINKINIKLSYKHGNQWINVAHRLDLEKQPDDNEMDGGRAYCNLQRYAHIPDLKGKYGYKVIKNKIEWDITSFGGLRYFNEKYNNKRYNDVYGYDVNSAYAGGCIGLIPDTRKCFFMSKIGKNQVGFDNDGKPVYDDHYHIYKYVFNLIKNEGLERWAFINFERKKKTHDDKYKKILNYAIGQMQHHNPFVRNVIIDNSNKYVQKYINDDTLCSNTDSIISLKKRDDLPIGDELHQFKLEHHGKFAYNGFNNQWNLDVPIFSGVPKSWFKKNWDLLKDPLPDFNYNRRLYDYNKNQIIDNPKWEELLCL